MKNIDEKTVRRRKTKLITVPKKKKVKKEEVNTSQKTQTKKKYVSKKRIQKRRKITLIFSLVLIFVITLSVLSCTVFFPIKNIKIKGNEKYNAEEILSSLGVIKGDNLLLASENRANKILKQDFDYIQSIEFNKKLPFTLEVVVNEYQVFSQIKQGNKYIKVASDGKILEISEKQKKGSPVVVGIEVSAKKVGEFVDLDEKENKISMVSYVLDAFEKNNIDGITLINLEDIQDIRVTYKDRIVMLLGSDSNLDKKLTHAKATLESKGNVNESGTLNLSRIPSAKNEASFIPRELEPEEMAKNSK